MARHRAPRFLILCLLGGLCVSTQTGCLSNYIGQRVAAPRNGGIPAVPASFPDLARFDRGYEIKVGPPDARPATLACGIVDPVPPGSPGSLGSPDAPGTPRQPRATVLVLQSWGGNASSPGGLWPLVHALAGQGYRLVLPDMRGQGNSTGDTVGAGALDARDLSQLLDQLTDKGEIAGPLGVMGHSYGAGAAILLAAEDPRIEAIVSFSPWQDWVKTSPITLRTFARRNQPITYALLGYWLPDATYLAAGRRSCAIIGVDPAQASPIRKMPTMDTPLLMVQGSADEVCLPQWSELLYDARPLHTERLLLAGQTHSSYFTERWPTVRDATLGWFAEHLGRETVDDDEQ